MHRRFSLIIASFVLALFALIPAKSVSAFTITDFTSEVDSKIDENPGAGGGLEKQLKEFCAKRDPNNNQMNLETWYSGKCTEDTFSGEGVGFSDIVILDLAEKLTGKNDPNQSFSDTFTILLNELKLSPSNPSQKTVDQAYNTARQKLFNTHNDSIVSQTSNLIGKLYQNQPASSISYLAYATKNLQNHKIIPQAVAADNGSSNGVGFSTFSPFLTLWIAVRNLAYLAIVVFFVVYGFMMMFRVNLGQKTVISVQLAIPKLIATLLIITFSYAIVGLIYDLMYVVIYFIFQYLFSQGIITTTGTSVGNTSISMVASGYSDLGMIGSLLVNYVFSIPASIYGVLNLVLGGTGSVIAGLAFLSPLGILVAIVLLVAIVISYAKLFVKLIGSFISIIVSLITAPITLLGNAFPGSNVIGNWFRGIVANVAVFPATMLLLTISYLLMAQPLLGICSDIELLTSSTPTTCQNIFGIKNLVPSGSPTISAVPLVSAIGGFETRDLLALLGVGLLLMSAKYVDIIKDALKVPPFKYGSDIGTALKKGVEYAPTVRPNLMDDSNFMGKAYGSLAKTVGVTPNNVTNRQPEESVSDPVRP